LNDRNGLFLDRSGLLKAHGVEALLKGGTEIEFLKKQVGKCWCTQI